MDDFSIGFVIGSLTVGIIATPFLMFFGIVYFNFRRIENKIIKETNKPEPQIIPDDETAKLLKMSEELLKIRK